MAVHASAAALPPGWDALAARHCVVLQRGYVAALEDALPAGTAYRFATATRGGRLVGAAAFHVVPLDLDRFSNALAAAPGVVRQALSMIEAVQRVTPCVLLCGNVLHADAPGFACAPGEQPAALLHALAEAVRTAEPHRARVVLLKEVDLPIGTDPQALVAHGYHHVTGLQPSMQLTLDPAWESWDDYLGALRKKYRQRARSARKRARGLTRRRLEGPHWAPAAPAMAALLRPVLERAELSLVPIPAGTLRAMATGLGARAVAHLYEDDGELVAFGLSVRGPGAVDGVLVGMNDDRNGPHKLYQNLLYDFVEEALAQRASWLSLGRTAHEIKSAIGAQPRPLAVFLRHPGLLHPVLGAAASRLTPPEWTPRHALSEM